MELTPKVNVIFRHHRRRYGTRRIVSTLADQGESIGRRRVEKIMKIQGLKAIQPKSFKPRGTESRHRLGYKPNLLLDALDVESMNQLWVGDITYIPITETRFGYLAILMDRFPTVTIDLGANDAARLKNLTVSTGKGGDVRTVNNVDLGLPISGGSFLFLGGAGVGRLVVTGDTDLQINDARLLSAASQPSA